MRRLRDLRKGVGFTQEALANALGVSQQAVGRWEKGDAEPSLSMLRDLAMVLGTSVDNLIEFEARGSRIPSQHWGPADELLVDGFWGHLGVLLPNHVDHQWYPITRGEEERISNILQGSGRPSDWLVVATLNNRVLLINPLAVQRIRLLDDAVDQPNDDSWNLTWDGYQGLSPEIYQAIGEYFRNFEEFESNCSKALQKMVIKQIEEHGIDEEGAFKLLECTYLYLDSGVEVVLHAQADELFSLTLDADCQAPERVVLRNDETDELNFFPTNRVALISMPLTQYQQAARESFEEMEDH
ncbi:helix-turn-helix transcriptional regulator [Pseudomonas gingeri]|uniref:helix-turn-helix transcriptional regulator n=1 Tax=Pseudomonas gingeri TaxID=117681 RepID=UPI0015C05909|nr:helix-turn-helix transcriptional regulator [Pseudomonas gingeri]NWE71176.1 helix-turn-helix transcriptional regulator [Pseudomonas gingeri]